MFRRVIETILITLIQIVGIFFVHNIFYSFYPIQHKEVGFGITIYFTGIVFIVLLFIYNLILEFYKKHIYSFAIIFLITSSILPLMSMNFRPFRSLMLIILLIFGFICSIILSKWRKNKFKLSNQLQNGIEKKLNNLTENKLEPKIQFHKKVEKYFNEISENKIPQKILSELITQIANTEYENYERFWNQYPKSRNRYSELKLEDLKHPFINYQISDFFKQNNYEKYEEYSMILLKMNAKEFKEYEIIKNQYETK
jgi:hypothetical protein